MQLYLSSGVRTNIRIAAAVGLCRYITVHYQTGNLGKVPDEREAKGRRRCIMSDLALLVRLVSSLRILGRL